MLDNSTNNYVERDYKLSIDFDKITVPLKDCTEDDWINLLYPILKNNFEYVPLNTCQKIVTAIMEKVKLHEGYMVQDIK